jgi:hypothetical protein
MDNKKIDNKLDNKYKDCDFEFLFKINDDIICQRFFFINGFNDKSLHSEDLKYAIDDIAYLINEDLKSKTRIYLYYNCCSFAKESDLEYARKCALAYPDEPSLYKYEIYSEKDAELNPDLVDRSAENIFTFSFKYKNKNVITKIWSADCYPSFIRNNVDITNKRKFENSDESQMSFEYLLLKRINSGKDDLVPQIIHILCDACSSYNRKEDFSIDMVYKHKLGEKVVNRKVYNYKKYLDKN